MSRTTMARRLFGKPVLKADEALNDSDKSFTVPADANWELYNLWVELVTTTTAGNRRIGVEFQDDSADVIASVVAGATQAASLTRNYLINLEAADGTSFIANSILTISLPRLILPESYVVRVFDVNAIDAAADDMVVQISLMERVEV